MGTKILLFGGNDTLQSLSNVDMYDEMYIDLIWKLTVFGIHRYLCRFLLKLKLFLSIVQKDHTQFIYLVTIRY